MSAAVRLGDMCSGHGGWPPRLSTSASLDVFINGIGAVRQNDTWAVHCNPLPSCHASVSAGGSSSVYVNGRPLMRIGDAIACGSVASQGSSSVFAG